MKNLINEISDIFGEIYYLLLIFFVILIAVLYVYDRYVQRKKQLLINYPILGRMRYFFEALREPFKQYFGRETYYDSRDKVDWVYKAAKNQPDVISFSVSEPLKSSRYLLKHANLVLNMDEVEEDFTYVLGKKREKPFYMKSRIIRSAMSDGALSPEATRAFALGAHDGSFTMNLGEGGMTTNHFFSLKPKDQNYYDIVKIKNLKKIFYFVAKFLFSKRLAIQWTSMFALKPKERETFLFCGNSLSYYRPNFNLPLKHYPEKVPDELPDFIYQIGSALYGMRTKEGEFNFAKYEKVMRFNCATEIKIAQGAKQTGGKLDGSKVSDAIAYYRGVQKGQSLQSPNRFPYAHTLDELFDFAEKLANISQKPVGIKVVISSIGGFREVAQCLQKRKKEGRYVVDFITVDGGDGGSGAAPLDMMESVGLVMPNAIYVANTILKEYGLREDITLIAGGKVLTPSDAMILFSYGADLIGIARAFMMSGGCIRARHCAGTGKMKCPVGMATQDKKKRLSYLTLRKAKEIANYHKNLLKGVKDLLAIMGKKSINDLQPNDISFVNKDDKTFFDMHEYYRQKYNNEL